MSAAKMVADSTQGDMPEMSSTKKRKKMVQKKKVKKKKESAKKNKKKNQEEEFDESDLDLEKEVYPIGHYVKDRENLLDQMFYCVKGQSLNRALPDVLKELPFEDLKRRCMEQLEVMSKKRIRRILAGDDPASISSSGTEDETSEDETQEMEEGQVDEEGMDSQVVDSTSFTLEVGDSDREFDYEEESVGQSSQSDEDQAYSQQYGEDYEDADDSDQAGPMEDDAVDDQLDNEHSDTPRTPEEPEEGEVIDDKSDLGKTTNEYSVKIGKEGSDDTETGLSDKDNTGTCDAKSESGGDDDSAEKAKNAETAVDDGKVRAESKDTVGSSEQDVNKTDDISSKEKSIDKTSETTVNDDTDVRVVRTEKDETDGKLGEKIMDLKADCEGTDNSEDHVINVESDHVIDEEAANIESEHVEGVSDEGALSEEEKETKVEKSAPALAVSEVKKGNSPRRIVKPPSQDIAPALTRNQMELLELEMRARAIKAMLKTAK